MARILYVEDHPVQRDLMAQMLELSGYEVAAACDGVDGVEQAHAWCPDLILMDLRMPRMDGFEAIKLLRSDPETADIPIIAISAWASANHKERALDAGADEHFTKPVDLSSLIETINRILTRDREDLRRRRVEVQAQLTSIKEPDTSSMQQSEALGRAFAATKHDLVGLLGTIQYDVDAMMTSPPTPERLRRVWRSARHAILLLQNVADLWPGGTLNLEAANLPDLIEEALDLVRPELKGRVEIKRDYGQELPGVKVDPLRFEQVLVNLFKNAREARANILRISVCRKKDGSLDLKVADNGEGIAQVDLKHLFELWHTTKTGEGRGVGLYIVKTVLDRHGWDIQVKSKQGEGTSFLVRIPSDSLTAPVRTRRISYGRLPGTPAKPKVLIADDNADTLDLYRESLQSVDYEIRTAYTLEETLDRLHEENYHVVVTDLRFLDESGRDEDRAGLRVLAAAREASPPTQVIVVTGFGSESVAQEVMQLGAYDYIAKPINHKRLQLSILKAIEARWRLLKQDKAPTQTGETPIEMISIIGNSPSMTEVIERVRIASQSKETVLIHGEGGTGKSFIAESIHGISRRRTEPFQIVNCASLALESLETIRDSWFASPKTDRGVFTQATGGTVYLDLVEELDKKTQRLLLKLIEEGEIISEADVRIISSLAEPTSRSLRHDLRRRLSEIEIYLPPLRERREDIPTLVGHFLRKYSLEYGLRVEMPEETMRLLQEYSYPDNVVELERAIKIAVRRARQGTIRPEHLPREIQGFTPVEPHTARLAALERQIYQRQINLNDLEKRRAKYDTNAPISLLNEIDALQGEIERLNAEKTKIGKGQEIPSSRGPKYEIHVHTAQGLVIGDHPEVTQTAADSVKSDAEADGDD